MDNNEIRIKTKAGTILVYANQKEQNAGIMLIPDGGDDEIDIAYVECIDDKHRNISNPNHDDLKNIHAMTYEDVWDENYTHDFIINGDEAKKSVTESYQPDSHKS